MASRQGMDQPGSSQLCFQLWRYGAALLAAANQAWQEQGPEQALKEAAIATRNERRFRGFFDSASMMMGIVELVGDRDIRHLLDNAASLKFFGRSAEEMRDRLSSELGTPQVHIQAWMHHYRTAQLTGAPVRFEYSHQTAWGECWLLATVYWIEDAPEDCSRFAYIVEDITDRKQAEVQIRQLNTVLEQRVQERTAQLEAANERLRQEALQRERALQELQQTEAALQVRAEQQAAIARLGQRALSGIDLPTLMRETAQLMAQTLKLDYCNILELLPQEQVLLLQASYGFQQDLVGRRTVSAGTDSQSGYTLLSTEPVVVTDFARESRFQASPLLLQYHIASGLSTVIAGHPQVYGVIGVYSVQPRSFTQDDIYFLQSGANILAEAIQRQRSSELLQRQAQELARANRLKDEFLATVPDELRNPMNVLLNWSKLLLLPSRQFSPEKVQQALEHIGRNAQILSQVIEDVLDMSNIIRGNLVLEVEEVELGEVVERAIASVKLAAQAKDIVICADLDAGLPRISGDGKRLQQVVWNLLSNAIKFTPPAGRVDVKLQRWEQRVQVQVSDTGQGIRPDFLPYVFDRFRQEDGSKTRSHRGMGLGLAIVRYLVEMHGGTIEAASLGPGQGATFTVWLPL